LRVPVGSLLPEYLSRKDFLQEYTLARAIADGIDPYLPTDVLAERYLGGLPQTLLPHPTPHPPTLGILLLPLALFDYSTAAVLWFGLEIVGWVVSVYLLGRAAGARLSIGVTLGIAAALLMWYPVWVEMAWGQLSLVMLPLLAGAWVALRSGRSALAGVLVGLAMLLKPVPFPLLLLFVLRKDWRALLGAGSVVLGGYVVAGSVVGLKTVETYFTEVLPLVTRIYRAIWGNISISSLGWRVFDGTRLGLTDGVVPPLVQSAAAAQVASLGLAILLLLGASWVVRRQRSLGVSLGVMMAVSILLGPISWPHYLVLAAIPAAQAIRWLVRHRLPSRETNWALIVAMLLVIDWVMVARPLALRAPIVDGALRVPFAVAQLPLMTAVSVAALAWLVAWLGPVDTHTPAATAD
jgi:hypothetical protein